MQRRKTMKGGGGRTSSCPVNNSKITMVSLMLNVIFGLILLFEPWSSSSSTKNQQGAIRSDNVPIGLNRKWHGGHPSSEKTGSCWCGSDKYCMCTPSLAIDLVISTGPNHDLWLVRRKDTNQLATMGGFVNVGETVEHAIQREVKEEMNIDINIQDGSKTNNVVTAFSSSSQQQQKHNVKLLGIYSDPRRDNRRHTVSSVFVIEFDDDEYIKKVSKPDDDVKDIQKIKITDIEKHQFFADHQTILLDYRRTYYEEDAKDDVVRSTCFTK